jgi:hypothetical protein
MSSRVLLVRTDVSEASVASIITGEVISTLGTTQAITNNLISYYVLVFN